MSMRGNDPGPSDRTPTSSSMAGTVHSAVIIDPDHTGNFIIIPPDGGWGWMVVVSAFLCNLFCDGVTYCFGIFLEDISKDMKCTITEVAITTSVLTATYYLLGPLSCAMTNRFGFRIVCFIGCALSLAVMGVSAYAPNIYMFIVVMGFIGGGGFSMIYITSVIIVGFYFEKWRAMATAISVSGSAVGVIVVPQIIGLLQSYTWRQQFLVLMSGFGICCICSLTYRPLKPVEIVEVKDAKDGGMLDGLAAKSIRSRRIDQASLNSEGNTSRFMPGTGPGNRFHNKMFPTAAEVHGSASFIVSVHSQVSGHRFRPKKLNLDENQIADLGEMSTSTSKVKEIIPTRPLYRDDIFFQGAISGLQQYGPSATKLEGEPERQHSYDYHMNVTRMATTADIDEQISNKCLCCPQSVKRILATMFDVNLLKQPSFTLFMISGFFTVVGLYVPYIYIVDMNIRNDMKANQARFLLSVIGFANAIGRVACGLISLSSKVKAIVCMEVCLIIAGISVVLMPFFSSLWMQYLCGSIFGLTNAANAALRSIVIVDLYGLENLTNAFGIAVLFQGLACCIGLPVSGILKEKTGSYVPVMIFAGSSITLSGLLILPIDFMNKKERERGADKIIHKIGGTDKIQGKALGT